MRNLLALIGLAAIAFVVAGYFKGWFTINGNDIEVHTEKAREDIQKGISEGLKRGIPKSRNASRRTDETLMEINLSATAALSLS